MMTASEDVSPRKWTQSLLQWDWVADGDEEYGYEVPQIQDEVEWRSGTNSDDLSSSGTRWRRQTWNLERKRSWFAVSPNILKVESRSPEWSDSHAWPPKEPDTADTSELHQSIRTYGLGPTTALWVRLMADRQANENGDWSHNIWHYLLISVKPLILSNCSCGARLRDRCRNIWWWSDSNDRDIGSWWAFEGSLNIIPNSKSMKIILHYESSCSVNFQHLEIENLEQRNWITLSYLWENPKS